MLWFSRKDLPNNKGKENLIFIYLMYFQFKNMNNTKHCIQILTLREENKQYIIKVAGFIFIEDKTQIVFNPSIKGFKKGHWTWHKDGKIHLKSDDGQVLVSHSRAPLSNFKGKSQFLFSGSAKDSDINIDYKLCKDSAVFLIDLRQFTKGLGLSIHVCDYFNVNRTVKIFKDKPRHQTFIYWKSTPKIVIIAFDN